MNIRLLVLDTNNEHAAKLAEGLRPFIPFIDHQVSGGIQEALEEHLENPFQVCLITSSIPDSQCEIFLRDMQTLYSQNFDKHCVFVGVRAELEPDFKLDEFVEQGYSTVISEKFDEQDGEKLKAVLADFTHAKELNQHIQDLDWSLKLILAEIDRVSKDRRRGRNTKFNTIVASFAADLVEFDKTILDKYFDVLTEQSEKSDPEKVTSVKIPAEVLRMKLPKLLENKYVGASSRVWQKLLKKYGVEEESPADQDTEGES